MRKNPTYDPDHSGSVDILWQNLILGIVVEQIKHARRKTTNYTTEAETKLLWADAVTRLEKAMRAKPYTPEQVKEGLRVFNAVWDANKRWFSYKWMKEVNVPLSVLSREQILATPKNRFSDKEWGELDDELTDIIENSDATNEGMIEDLEREIREMYVAMDEASENYDYDESDMFNVGVATAQDAGFNTEQFFGYAGQGGLDNHDIRGVLDEILEDDTNWDVTIRPWEYEEGRHVKPIDRTLIITPALVELAEQATPEQVATAFERLDSDYPSNEGFGDDLTQDTLSRMSSVRETRWTMPLEPSHAMYLYPDERVEDYISETLHERMGGGEEQFESEGEPEPEEDRILYTFKDGAYVLRMIPEDLPETGEELGQCIKDPDYNYGTRINNGEIALYSIRTKAGRPKITIEIELDADGTPQSVGQILGAGNRQPGIGGKKVKWMEVQKIGKVLELLGFDPSSDARNYLGRAHSAMGELEDPKAKKLTQNPRKRRRR